MLILERRLIRTKEEQIEEFTKLATLLEAPYDGETLGLDFYATISLEGQYKGYGCKVVARNEVATGSKEKDFSSSVTLMIELDKPTDEELSVQSVQNELRTYFTATAEVDEYARARAEHPNTKLIDTKELELLEQSGLEYDINLLPDRLSFTVYGIYRAMTYKELLDYMLIIVERIEKA